MADGLTYNITTLQARAGSVSRALQRLKQWIGDNPFSGRLAAVLYSEIGVLDRILLIHEYESTGGMAADRDIVFNTTDPYGIGDLLIHFTMDAYSAFPGVGEIPVGAVGPYFEVRSYSLTPGGIGPTLEAWAKVLNPRREVSPLLTVAYARSGVMPRFIHIWPYQTVEDRFHLRAEAVERGVWPPPGGIDHITRLESAVYLAADFSSVR